MRRQWGVGFAVRVVGSAAALMMPAAAGGQGLPIEFACGTVGTAAVVAGPMAVLSINGSEVDVSTCIAPVGKMFALDVNFSSAVGTGSMNALMNPDPFISFGFTTNNFVAGPVNYNVFFTVPIVPGLYDQATSSGGVTVAPGVGGIGAVSAGSYPAYISGWSNAFTTNHGVDIGTTSCSAITFNNVCNYGPGANSFPPTPYLDLNARLSYAQTTTGSIASWSGRVDLFATVIPEPSSIALFGGGAALLGLGARFRRRTS